MKKIFKYPLTIDDSQEIEMPKGATILAVNTQECLGFESMSIWAMVDSGAPPEKRIIRIMGTGHPIYHEDRLKYIGTAKMADGKLMWHVFEQIGG